MSPILIAAILGCSQAKIVDMTNSWGDEQDLWALKTAAKRCESYYGKEAPCLKVFTKAEQGVYRAVRGKNK